MTTRIPMEELIKRCRTAYKLVVLASKRSQELNEGAPKLIEGGGPKITTIALEEIRQGKVSCEVDGEAAEAESPKRKRAAKEPAESNGGRDAAKKKKS
ncbi:MAG: DNA-directed RNA polymerase subunit omega [Candidatus Omnitrophica bacterium]|nr:DNA-directed RNA polymerase subunit omega [Candidatus Omnitrophota bacterium]